MLRKTIGATVVALMLAACSDPMSTQLSLSPEKWPEDVKPVMSKLSDDDKALLIGYMTRATLATSLNHPLENQATTLGDALAQQKAWVAQQEAERAQRKAIEAKEKAEKERLAKLLSEAAEAELKQVGIMPHPRNEFIKNQVLVVEVRNKTDKTITGVSGAIKVFNQFDTQIGGVSFEISEEIPAHGSVEWIGERHYNEFIESHKALVGLDLSTVRTVFEPEMIVFADGQKLKASPM